MNGRVTPFLMPLAVLSFVGWLALATRSDPPTATGSAEAPPALPFSAAQPRCDGPISWRVAYVDPRFGLAPAAVEAAAREAAELWTDGSGRPLFVRDSLLGMPIRLVYDERQARTDERVRAEQVQRRAEVDVDAEGDELGRAWGAHMDARRRNLAEWAQHDAGVAAHNAAVQRWNSAGNVPPDTVDAFTAREERFRLRGLRLLDAARRLQAAEEELRARERALSEARAALDADAARLAGAYPPQEMESGTYLEAQATDVAGMGVTLREIRIFRFGSRQDLIGVLAHELGHALGLPHVDFPGAVMSARQVGGERATTSLLPADRSALEALCR
jgi:hypothetical protein